MRKGFFLRTVRRPGLALVVWLAGATLDAHIRWGKPPSDASGFLWIIFSIACLLWIVWAAQTRRNARAQALLILRDVNQVVEYDDGADASGTGPQGRWWINRHGKTTWVR
jgi:hypothetical protein